jgi:hemin uptake protein HemP
MEAVVESDKDRMESDAIEIDEVILDSDELFVPEEEIALGRAALNKVSC